MNDFLTRNAAVEVAIVGISVGGQGKYNSIQIRGKMPIMVNNAQRPIGFKFILPASYPNSAPYVYLDEVENQQVVSLIDYVDAGNRIRCEYINMWAQRYQDIQYRASLNLNQVSKASQISYELDHCLPQPFQLLILISFFLSHSYSMKCINCTSKHHLCPLMKSLEQATTTKPAVSLRTNLDP